MIAWLEGIIIQKSPDATIINVNGVGYLVTLSLSSFCLLPEVGEKISIEIYTYVREDQITLFGFIIDNEKELFKKLMTVAGIGPRLSLGILSGISPKELVDAIKQSNLRRLQTVPGVGKKTAERILIELKDKVNLQEKSSNTQTINTKQERHSLSEDLQLALSNLGYKKIEIERAIYDIPKDSSITLEAAIRLALNYLHPKV